MKIGLLADFLLPLLVAAAATALIGLTGADLAVQALFYEPGSGWFMGDREPWAFLYHYGNIPAFALAAAGGAVFVLGLFMERFRRDRTAALFVVAFLALGPGLVVNTVFKDHWGRPRPADIVQFGGPEAYRPAWSPGEPGQGRSFPSGHAAVGFFVMAPIFVLKRRAPGWARKALAAGILYGMMMGLARMIQGGHFLTDVIWSGVLVYLAGLALYHLFRLDREGLPAVRQAG
jgi:membrane-associated PAP2 superfamily phosphatase